MPSLSEFRNALASVNDQVRRGELNKMHDLVQRDIILYASNFSMPTSGIPSGLISINDSNIQSFMSVLYETGAAEQKPPRPAITLLHGLIPRDCGTMGHPYPAGFASLDSRTLRGAVSFWRTA